MTEQTAATDVRVAVHVDAAPEQAFRTFVERGDDWWPGVYRLGEAERTDLRIEPRAGGRWYEETADGARCDWGRVLAWEPPGAVALSWQISPRFAAESDPERASRVDVTFAAAGDGTIVSLVHHELERHGEEWPALRESLAAEGGWPGVMAAYAALASR
jgi:uncharacterized protein YndB with AHSA1/START domain